MWSEKSIEWAWVMRKVPAWKVPAGSMLRHAAGAVTGVLRLELAACLCMGVFVCLCVCVCARARALVYVSVCMSLHVRCVLCMYVCVDGYVCWFRCFRAWVA